MVVGACQIFQFFRQITWFLGNDTVLSKCRCRILHYLTSIMKLQKNHSVKSFRKFYIDHASHLKTKTNSNFAVSLAEMLKEPTIHFCLFGESHFSNICTL